MTEDDIDQLLLTHLWIGHDGMAARPPHERARVKVIESVAEAVALDSAHPLGEPGEVARHVAARFDVLIEEATRAQIEAAVSAQG